MKITKDGTTGNVVFTDEDDAACVVFTPGAYVISGAGETININGHVFKVADVSHLGTDAFDGTVSELIQALNDTFFNFAPA